MMCPDCGLVRAPKHRNWFGNECYWTVALDAAKEKADV